MENFDVMLEPVRMLLSQVAVFLPRLALALVVLIAGWLLAKGTNFTVVRALRAVNFHILTERAGMDGFLRQGGIQSGTTELFGLIGYWLVILATLIIAFNGLGLTYITDLLREIVLFLPKVIVALLILAFGSYFARFIANSVSTYCSNVGIRDGDLLGRLAQYAIMVFVALIALDQVNVGGAIVRQSFLIILAGVVLALALAFGIGGQHWAGEQLKRWWPRAGGDPENGP